MSETEDASNPVAIEGKSRTRLPSLKKSELSKLSKDIAMDKVFCSFFIPEEQHNNVLGLVFMPLLLGGLSHFTKEQVDDIGFVYEYFDKAGPRSINGKPIFYSCSFVSKADAKRIRIKVLKIRKLLDEV